ncbi:hypothetical protein [Tumebacillus permanentifrigoris]|uniref:Uncharacterized protein n=1 Tax=Tumebacillus permanentifrigoris TaxID=378543 RepID=A0A316DAL2_9BACL|nr:hypothetical protein [Tumebacillus permanentifrigoris]PWK13862.1 hypothetical protein C7459_106142 [Tumebacillus permanentifrigoris]
MQRKHTMRAFVYLTVGLAMLFYALPRVPDVTMDIRGVFTISWLAFAMLFIGANLYYLIGVDKERQIRRRRSDWLARTLRNLREPTNSKTSGKRRYMN